MDVYDKAKRSYVMSRIRGRDTKAEILLRKFLCRENLKGYRIHRRLPGRPDISYGRYRLAIFIDGCFWHGCPICKIPLPNSNKLYWHPKLRKNRIRDGITNRSLRRMGWQVVRFWEHEVKEKPSKCIEQIIRLIEKRR